MDHVVKLDKSKPYGVVVPPENGAHFHQEGFYFTHHGDLAKDMLDDTAKERLRKLENRKKADAAAAEARKKFLEQSGLSDADLEGEDALTTVMHAATVDSGAVDLIGWAKGEKQYPFFAVRRAVKEQYAYAGDTKDSILTWMVDNKKVPETDVKR
jgi:hypothetical protein